MMPKPRFRDLKHGRAAELDKPDKTGLSLENLFPNKRRRAKAFITDGFMLVMPIMYLVFYVVMGGREGFAANKLLGWVYILVPLIFVQIAFLAKTSQTPGIKAYSIKVVDAVTLEVPAFGQIVLRQILTMLSLAMFGWLLMFFRSDHRMLHELLSKTALVMVDDASGQRSTS
jgi:uncharacterized RDD family membrane protein YckC